MWSPTRRLSSIDGVGISNPSKTNVLAKSAKSAARRTTSRYSRKVAAAPALKSVDLQDRQERLLREVDAADLLHPLLALFLLLEELLLAGDVAAVALRDDVLAERLDRLPRQDLRADRRLDDHLEHLLRDHLLHLLAEGAALVLRLV